MSGTDRESLWRQHVQAWRESGLTLKAYAEVHGVDRWALGRWSRRVTAEDEVSAPGPGDSPGAVPMTASGPLMMEIVEAAPRRRRWSETEKERLVAETCAPGMSVSLVARRRGVDPSLLFRWRRRLLVPTEAPPVFAPVEVANAAPVALIPAPPTSAGGGLIEIELAGGRRLRVDRDVDAAALRRVLSVLERS